MIAVVGNDSVLSTVRDVAAYYGLEQEQVGRNSAAGICETILKKEYRQVIISLDEVHSAVDEMLDSFEKLSRGMTAPVIFLMGRYAEDRTILQAFEKLGVCISETVPAGIKRRLIEYLEPGSDTLQKLEQEKPDPTPKKQEQLFRPVPVHKTVTVAVCGALPRMGATTQTLQLLRFLQMQQKKVCYVELNRHGHIKLFPEMYETSQLDESSGCVRFEGMELYYEPERISDILDRQYDFILYDFGSLQETDLVSYLEKDIKIIVCGSKPYELGALMQAFERLEQEKVFYVFSFSHISEHFSIREQMGEKGSVTCFAGYSPSLFDYQAENEGYHRMMLEPYLKTEYEDTGAVQKKRRLPLFGRRA